VRLQQIATGGGSVPRRSGEPSIRNTESSTQGVIQAVYVQVLGTGGYANDRLKVEEIKLENGDINLREFVRQVARSKAFRNRFWSGLYITKAIEVMHRRLLGRPSFGRWEINSYFDIAARKGFYGVVDAMLNSREYNESFGEDTVPYERYITPNDLNSRRVPALRTPLNLAAIAEPGGLKRPEVAPSTTLNTPGSLTVRNLQDRSFVAPGGWTAKVAGIAPADAKELRPATDSSSVRQLPEPSRSWSAPRWQPGGGNGFAWTPSAARWTPSTGTPAAGIAQIWSINRSNSSGFGQPQLAETAMAKALRPGNPEGFRLRNSLNNVLRLAKQPSPDQLQEVIEATYRQLLNRVPFGAERLGDAESMLSNGQLCVADFVAQVANSELFQQRLYRMAPLRAATAAHLALLGRAPLASEVSAYLATRATAGQQKALEALLNSTSYTKAFGRDTVPYLQGFKTQAGLPLSSISRTAALYGGNAALNPPIKGSI
jgi:phycobilisome core-membrane linker protein